MAFEEKDRETPLNEDLVESNDTVNETVASVEPEETPAEAESPTPTEEKTPAFEEEAPAAKKAKKASKKKPKLPGKGDGRRLRYGSLATVVTVVVVALIFLFNIVVNIIETRYPLTLDLTDDQLYTLSDESKEIASSITQDVSIVVCADETTYTSPSLSSDALNKMFMQLHEVLASYQSLSNGHVSVRYLDLTANPTEASIYTELGATTYSLVFQSGDRTSVMDVDSLYTYDSEQYAYYQYGYISLSEVPFYSEVENALATQINKVTNDKLTVVTMLTGHNEDDSTISALTSLLGDLGYDVQTNNITASEAFDESCSLMVIPAPADDYTEEEIARLRQWVDNDYLLGHHVMYIANWQGTTPNLNEYIEDTFGIEVTQNLISQSSASYTYNNYSIYSYADVATSPFTSASDSWVLTPMCLQLKIASGWDNDYTDEEENQWVTPLYTFPTATTELIDLTTLSSDEVTTMEPDVSTLIGGAVSYRESYVDSEFNTSYCLVFGSATYCYSNFLNMKSISNKDGLTASINGVVGNDNNLDLPEKALTDETAEFGSSLTVNLLLVLFVIVIPVITLIVCLVVFLKRRHL